jgi:hypothetical protein
MRRKLPVAMLRISIRAPASTIYNGRLFLPRQKQAMLLEIWEFLEEVRRRARRVNAAAMGTTVKVRLPSGNHVLLEFCKPLPGDPDEDFDLSLVNIFWPDQMN